jgi:hypothetical protein
MSNYTKNQIKVQEIIISISKIDEQDFLSLTDMAKYKDEKATGKVIQNWLRTRSTIEFLGFWEKINNPDFNIPNFEYIKNQTGKADFTISVKEWVAKTNAIGITSRAGRYGGTYAHKDIAFEFATWLSPEFKLYVIKEFQRLKENEADSKFQIQRLIAKRNYKIQTQAIKENILPTLAENDNPTWIYATEADLLNLAVWGMTAKQWRKSNQDKPADTNIRDYALVDELIVLSNLEVINSKLIENKIEKKERYKILCETAISQFKIFRNLPSSQQIN